MLSQIGSDYSVRPPTVSELWLLFRQVAAIAFCITRRRKPICPVEKIVNVLRAALGMLCPFGRLQSFVVLRKQSKVSDYFCLLPAIGVLCPLKQKQHNRPLNSLVPNHNYYYSILVLRWQNTVSKFHNGILRSFEQKCMPAEDACRHNF